MSKTYRKMKIKKEIDGRFDVYERGEVIAENFQTMSVAMEWIDVYYLP